MIRVTRQLLNVHVTQRGQLVLVDLYYPLWLAAVILKVPMKVSKSADPIYFFRVSPRSLMRQLAILGSSPDLNAAASHYRFSGYFN